MRSIAFPLVLASMVAAIGCSSDRALAPKSGHTNQISDLPPELFAAYSRTSLPGTETVVALNDNGDVVGATATGGVLWHGATHERTTLPIIPTAIANDGTVAGSIGGHAATWKDGHTTVLDTATSAAAAICRCESATVVGSVEVDGVTHAAIWADGIRIDAGMPPNTTGAQFTAIGTGFVVGIAIVPTPDPRTGGTSNFPRPYSWSPAGGWVPFSLDANVFVATIVALNSHGQGVGFGSGPNSFNSVREIRYDVAAGTGVDELSGPTILNVAPTGINDSGLVSATADIFPGDGTSGSIGLVNGRILPPGVLGDRTAGINSTGIVGGQSEGLPVLWIPNP
jgi:hypothetical protein